MPAAAVNTSANSGIGQKGDIGRQFAGYLPFSPKMSLNGSFLIR